MIQALYSRSAKSAEEHMDRVKRTGAEKFMADTYVGYGHKSIADCGSTTLFFENVSILAAKAIQNNPMYSGQETSTRYLDFGGRPMVDPLGTGMSGAVQDMWMDFYRDNRDIVCDHVRKEHPRHPEDKEVDYERALGARTFDIMRAFIPAGATTQLSWHTNLRQASDHLIQLCNSPLGEVRAIGETARAALAEQYASSGFTQNLANVSGINNKDVVASTVRAEWEASMWKEVYRPYADVSGDGVHMELLMPPGLATSTLNFHALRDRPRGCGLPQTMGLIAQVHFMFNLDYGSWRDIQRHRNGVCVPPLLTTAGGFEPWYLEQLPPYVRGAAHGLIHRQEERIAQLSGSAEEKQYYIPLGYRVRTLIGYPIQAAVYVMELRSGKTIHPTLRRRVHQMIRAFQEQLPFFKLHVDMDPDDWTVRRGQQTITIKSEGT